MSITQNIYNIQIKTTDTKIDEQTIFSILNKAIGESKYNADLTYKLCKKDTVYDFTENMEMFFAFIKYNKKEFFEKYPYLTENEYNLTLFAFNQNPIDILLNFIEYTNIQELAEPYNLIPEECNRLATNYANKNMQAKEFEKFIKTAEEKGIKLLF